MYDQNTPIEIIEILSVDLLDQHRQLVENLKQFARSLRLEFGWHYLLDLTWIISRLGPVDGKRIIDAGAGTGVLQWYLASQGAEVISVDRLSRKTLPLRFRSRFHVQGLRPNDLEPAFGVIKQRFTQSKGISKLINPIRETFDAVGSPPGKGQVLIYNQDLSDLADITEDTIDAIVAVSSLEHNSQSGLSEVTAELMRTLKPDSMLLATLTSARDEDWWHDESSAWCYTDSTLRELFALPSQTESNYDQYDELLDSLRNCTELRDNLASFYFTSDSKGMPRGIWDPQYQPVGVCKIKTSRESKPKEAK